MLNLHQNCFNKTRLLTSENSYMRRTMQAESETLLNLENEKYPMTFNFDSAIALWTIYRREIKWFSIEHVINKKMPISACDNRKRELQKKIKAERNLIE